MKLIGHAIIILALLSCQREPREGVHERSSPGVMHIDAATLSCDYLSHARDSNRSIEGSVGAWIHGNDSCVLELIDEIYALTDSDDGCAYWNTVFEMMAHSDGYVSEALLVGLAKEVREDFRRPVSCYGQSTDQRKRDAFVEMLSFLFKPDMNEYSEEEVEDLFRSTSEGITEEDERNVLHELALTLGVELK